MRNCVCGISRNIHFSRRNNMNSVSIIINGIRYDGDSCDKCDLADFCQEVEMHCYTCSALIGMRRCFKKSTKSFEP